MSQLHNFFREFLEFTKIRKFILYIVITIVVAVVSIIEPIFMAKTIGFLEDFQKTQVFAINDFLLFLATW